jgi:hypothetical protein
MIDVLFVVIFVGILNVQNNERWLWVELIVLKIWLPTVLPFVLFWIYFSLEFCCPVFRSDSFGYDRFRNQTQLNLPVFFIFSFNTHFFAVAVFDTLRIASLFMVWKKFGLVSISHVSSLLSRWKWDCFVVEICARSFYKYTLILLVMSRKEAAVPFRWLPLKLTRRSWLTFSLNRGGSHDTSVRIQNVSENCTGSGFTFWSGVQSDQPWVNFTPSWNHRL